MRTRIFTICTLIAFSLFSMSVDAQRQAMRSSGATGNSNNTEVQKNRTERRGGEVSSRQNQQRNPKGHASSNTVVVKKNREPKHYHHNDAVVVTHRTPRVYPDIHEHHERIVYHNVDYAYSHGRYYRYVDNQYTMIAPPRGIRVRVIPQGFLTIMVQSIPYYYFEGVYYRHAEDDNYEVVNPPMGAIVPELPEYDVKALVINGKTVFEYDGILYKPVVTESGVQYKVIGTIDE